MTCDLLSITVFHHDKSRRTVISHQRRSRSVIQALCSQGKPEASLQLSCLYCQPPAPQATSERSRSEGRCCRDRIENVATAQELEDEEPDILRQQSTNNTLLETNNLLDTAKAHAVGEQLLDLAIELNETDDISSSYYQHVYETLITDCRAFCQSIKRLSDHVAITALMAKLDPPCPAGQYPPRLTIAHPITLIPS